MFLKLLFLAAVAFVHGKESGSYVAFVLDGRNSEKLTNGKAWIEDCLKKSCIANIQLIILSTSWKQESLLGPMEKEDFRRQLQQVEPTNETESAELLYEVFKNALDIVPNLPSHLGYTESCRIYAFLDPSLLTEKEAQRIFSISKEKHCVINPVQVSSRKRRSLEMPVDPSKLTGLELLFWLTKATGGSIITAEKPSTPEEMLKVLEEELSMEGCRSKNISGPLPNGYACKEDCLRVKMCWDETVGTCFCNETYCSKKIVKWSKCPRQQCQKIIKREAYVIEHPYDCRKYYKCTQGKSKGHVCYGRRVFSGNLTKPCIGRKKAPPCKKKSRSLAD